MQNSKNKSKQKKKRSESKNQKRERERVGTGGAKRSIGSAAKAVATELSRNRRTLPEMTDFPVICGGGGGEVGRSESDAVGCGERSHECSSEKATRIGNGRSQKEGKMNRREEKRREEKRF